MRIVQCDKCGADITGSVNNIAFNMLGPGTSGQFSYELCDAHRDELLKLFNGFINIENTIGKSALGIADMQVEPIENMDPVTGPE